VPIRGYALVVPEGFRSDLASIPRYLWPIIAPFELSEQAPLVHDWLYGHRGQIADRSTGIDRIVTFTRWQTDGTFRDIMKLEGVADWRRFAGYAGVRVGGHWRWST
jgi:hypothetical protein